MIEKKPPECTMKNLHNDQLNIFLHTIVNETKASSRYMHDLISVYLYK